jgi:PAS domain S-box-containing protein
MKKQPSSKRENPAAKILFLGIAVAASFWFFDAVVDTFIFKEGGFAGNLLFPEAQELWMRLIIVGMIIGISVYAQRNITRRKRAVDELKGSHERLLSVLESLDAVVYVADMETHEILFANKYIRDIFGDVDGKVCWQTLQADQSYPCNFCTNDKLVSPDGEPTGVYAWEFQNTVNGRWYDIRDRAIRWVDGRLVRLEIAVDVTERKKVETDLKVFTNLINQSNDAIFVIEAETGRFLDANKRTCESLGYECGELLGLGVKDIEARLPDDFSWKEHVKEVSDKGYLVLEGEHRRKDGTTFPVEVNVRHITHDGRDYMLAVARDIAERKRLEEEKEKIRAHLFREQQLEALGLLAGGVAHHFKNLLNSVRGYSELMMMEIKSSEPWYEYFKRILSSVESAVEISDRLYFFARKKSVDFRHVNINYTVEDLLRMLNPIIGGDIDITTELEPGLWTTRADEGSIEEAIMNLVVNAKDAMKGKGGGEITIKTENVTLNKARSKAQPESRPGRFVLLSVVDTGVGMDTEHMEHVFEPFFSTKDIGEGTGLGLSFVYGVAKQHDGWVNAYSEQGKGAAFKIYLPAVKGKPEKSEKTKGEAEEAVP